MRYELDGFSVELESGFEISRSRYGETVSFDDLEGLSKAIVSSLVSIDRRLTRAEFRYIRRTCELTQADVAQLLGVEERTISNWENRIDTIPLHADVVIRVIASKHLGLPELSLEHALLNARAVRDSQPMRFAFHDGWQNVATTLAYRSLAHARVVVEVVRDPVLAPLPWPTPSNGGTRLIGIFDEPHAALA